MRERSRLRIGESLGESVALGREVREWRLGWESVDAVGMHLTQLDLLCDVVTGLTDEITRRIGLIDPAAGDGAVYEECRREDVRVLHARRLWRWYADKLDQRAGPAGDIVVQTLLAADEVVWSCWKTAFSALGEETPPAPIPFVSPLYSASATPRTDPPPELRPGTDDLLRAHIERLPVAAVGLPPVCCRRPWWLILAAHETGHHVQFEAAGSTFEELTQECVVAAAYRHHDDVELAEMWRPWCRELFADACAMLLVGSAALWAAAELETRSTSRMLVSPSGSYPPPVIRLAVLQAVADAAAVPLARRPDASPSAARDDRVGRLLDCVPHVAEALVGLEAAPGRGLRALATATARAYGDGGSIGGWCEELLGVSDPQPQRTLDAARFCAAAGVEAWQRSATRVQGNVAPWLAGRLRAVLPRCQEPGDRAAAAPPAVAGIVAQVVADLYQPGGSV
jgi:hypothetical protein